ncbi:gluconolactonase [Stappia sp. 22II-S9-Z10]|nr:gluconolactonase [Stappia sp. 22II-S9-Z10]
MAHDALTPAFRALVDEQAPVRQVGSGFQFTEGPVWHPDGYLLFSDIPGDVRRRASGGSITEVKRGTNKGNGQTFDADLSLIVCEHATSSLVRIASDGTRTVLASHFEGRELNSPNDVIVSASGWIYFTDPWYGRMAGFGVERPRELGFQGVYRVKPGMAEPELLVDRTLFTMPNGLCFSPDESRLYVNDTEQTNIRVFDVGADGRLSRGRMFASGIKDALKPGVPDGMKCDFNGNVWVTAPGGIWVYAPDGRHIGRVAIPENTANFHWGGPDWRTLYVTASTSLYTLPVKVGPRSEPFMRTRPERADRTAPAEAGGGALDPARCALIIQDMQNDAISEGGAFAASGAPAHCREQRAVENAARLAERCRALGVPVIFVWFIVEEGAAGVTMNAPLFEGLVSENALVRGSWGAAPVEGLEARPGDYIVEKCRMSAWEGTRLETILKAEGRDTLISCGAWTNMSVEHTARTGADKGYLMIVPEDACATMNADWHRASIDYALQNVSAVTTTAAVLDALG